jgi:hypothetical protein
VICEIVRLVPSKTIFSSDSPSYLKRAYARRVTIGRTDPVEVFDGVEQTFGRGLDRLNGIWFGTSRNNTEYRKQTD